MPEPDRTERLGDWLEEQVEDVLERATDSISKAAQHGADPSASAAEADEIDRANERANAQLHEDASDEAREHLDDAIEEQTTVRPLPTIVTQVSQGLAGVAVFAGLLGLSYLNGWRPSGGEPEQKTSPPLVRYDFGTLPSQDAYDAIDSARKIEESFTELMSLSASQEAEMNDRLKAFKQGRFFEVRVPNSLARLSATLYAVRAEPPSPVAPASAEVAELTTVQVAEGSLMQVLSIAPEAARDQIIEQIGQAYADEVSRRQQEAPTRGNLNLPSKIEFGPSFGSFRIR